MTTTCKHCGTEVHPNDTFCQECGYDLRKMADQNNMMSDLDHASEMNKNSSDQPITRMPESHYPPTGNHASGPGYTQGGPVPPVYGAAAPPPYGYNNAQYYAAPSYFDGSVLENFGYTLLIAIGGALTLGIATPWILCAYGRWMAEHTFINGRQLAFNGTGAELFGKWIVWFLLTIVTLGIYGIWVPVRFRQWYIEHTYLTDTGYTPR